MAVAFITDQVVTSSADASSAGLTVPADCNCLVLIVAAWENNGGIFPPTALTLNGVALTTVQAVSADDAFDMILLSALANPATGAQTLAWDWAAGADALNEGAVMIAAYFKGVDTAAPVLASGNTTVNTDVTGLGSPGGGDMMVGGSSSTTTAVTVTGSAQTSLATPAAFNNKFARGAWKLGANVYDISGGGDATVHAALVLRAAAAAAASLVPAHGNASFNHMLVR